MAGRTVRIAAVQFESSDRDKGGNLQTMERLAKEAVKKSGANLVCFHEACITGVSPRFSTHATPFYGSMAKGHSFLPVEHLRMVVILNNSFFLGLLFVSKSTHLAILGVVFISPDAQLRRDTGTWRASARS